MCLVGGACVGQDMEVSYFHHYKDNVDWVFLENNAFHNMEKNIYQGSREVRATR